MSSRLQTARVATRTQQAREVGLRLVAPVRQRAARTPFVVVMITVLAVGLTGLVLLSTVLQAQAFTISDLTEKHSGLVLHKQALADEVERLSSPEQVAEQARRQGMVPGTSPVFLRLSDGTVIGDPVPAGAAK